MQTINTKLNNPISPLISVKLPSLWKVYVWAICFEMLLFFVLFSRIQAGITGHLARLLDALVLMGLFFKLVIDFAKSKSFQIRIPNFLNPLYIYFTLYFALLVFAGVIGLLSNTYSLTQPYESSYVEIESELSKIINSEFFRPIFEHVITLYYFIFFAVLPQYFLNTKKNVEYFFSVFKKLFIISYVLGMIDFGLATVNMAFIPRHITDWVFVGTRFHGLAGEPRDAFVYLFFGLAILHLEAHFKGHTLNKWWVIAVIVAAAFTQSASGLLGIIFFMTMYSVYILRRLSIRQITRLSLLMSFSVLLLYFVATQSERIMTYAESASDLWNILETKAEIPYVISVQLVSIYPLYDLTVKLRELNILPILIGSGLGSASVINNIYMNTGELSNPNSQFVRVIFESGLVGTYFFIMTFIYPVKRLTRHLSSKKKNEFILLTFLVLGVFFGHRSASSFIYLGILIAVFRVLNNPSQHSDPLVEGIK